MSAAFSGCGRIQSHQEQTVRNRGAPSVFIVVALALLVTCEMQSLDELIALAQGWSHRSGPQFTSKPSRAKMFQGERQVS